MRIYTRGGDRGKTTLIGAVRRYKHDVRVEAYGTVDEAGAFIGMAQAALETERDRDVLDVLASVQQRLWDVGADLACARPEGHTYRTPAEAAGELEPWIDRYEKETEPITHFVIRGGTPAAAALHVACTVVRRAERRAVALMAVETVHPPTLAYLNRLSDLLFVLARVLNARAHAPDVRYENGGTVFH